ncbi:MAG: CarD family transcriptional regulator [Bacillota bacterium]|nr:CarD family transcriptional regulator [Bacillota bacterium]
MFKVNDYVVHGLTGVCQISDIKKDDYASNEETLYYILKPVYDMKMIIKIPVNNAKNLMRPIITKEDVLSLIKMMPEIKPVSTDNERERAHYLKTALKLCENEERIKIIKTLFLEKKAKNAVGKKLTKTDEDIMNIAEKQLNEEFAIALNISTDEAASYIMKHITQQ